MNAFEIFGELEKTKAKGEQQRPGETFPRRCHNSCRSSRVRSGSNWGVQCGRNSNKNRQGQGSHSKPTTFSKGDEISADLGIMLAKLGINPIEIGLILTGAIEEGHIFDSSDLNLDIDGLRSDIISATSGAFNLACNMEWFSDVTTPTLISNHQERHYLWQLRPEYSMMTIQHKLFFPRLVCKQCPLLDN